MTLKHLMNSPVVAILVASAPLMAQGVSAQLSGHVVGKGGEALAGASVVIRNTETGFVRTVATDSNGRYIAVLLPVGPYQVTVTKAGFQTASNIKVNLNLGDAAPLTVRLAPDTGATVEVVASVSAIDSERSASANAMSPEALTILPVKGRGFTDFAFLTPQVTLSFERGNIAIGGQRGINTSINVDGGDYNDPFFGGTNGGAEGKTPFTVSIEAIREFQVVTDGASAEFGRMGGGYLNAITKSGTNELSGSLFYYMRPKAFVEKQANVSGTAGSTTIADFKTEQYGFSVGGPILKDKLLYFVAYDGQKETRPVNFTWGGNSPVTLDPVGNPNDAALLARSGAYTTKADSATIFGRLDWLLNNDHTLQFRVNRSEFTGNTSTGILNAKDNTSTDDIKTLSLIGQWNWVIGTNWINEFRVSYAKEELPRTPQSTAPQVFITNVGTYGKYPFTREFSTIRKQFTETLSYITTLVQVKAGIDMNITTSDEVFAPNVEGNYSFSSLANFRAGNWTSYQQAFGLNGLTGRQAGTFNAEEKELAAFVQTDWRLADSLKVGVGLRMDRQEHASFSILSFANPLANPMPLNQTIPTDTQISPRLSFTWTPEADKGRTVVRGSAGVFVSRTPAVFLYQVYVNNAQRSATITFQSGQAATYGIPIGSAFNAQNPFVLASLPGGATPPPLDLWTFSQDFKNPRTTRMRLEGERNFNGWVLGIAGSYAKAVNLERVTDVNLTEIGVNAYGRPIFNNTGGLNPVYSGSTASSRIRPNATFGRMGLYVSDAESTYRALTLSAKYQKADSPFQAQFFYTWSEDKDNDSNERNFSAYQAQNPYRLGDEWSYSNNDRRHVLTGYASYLDPVTKVQLGLNARYLSGTPYTLTFGTDLNMDSFNNDRVLGTARNSQRTASQMFLDLKLSRDWALWSRAKFTLSVEVFNLLNRADTYARTRVRSGSTDAAVTLETVQNAVSTPRQVQLGARLAF